MLMPTNLKGKKREKYVKENMLRIPRSAATSVGKQRRANKHVGLRPVKEGAASVSASEQKDRPKASAK